MLVLILRNELQNRLNLAKLVPIQSSSPLAAAITAAVVWSIVVSVSQLKSVLTQCALQKATDKS